MNLAKGMPGILGSVEVALGKSKRGQAKESWEIKIPTLLKEGWRSDSAALARISVQLLKTGVEIKIAWLVKVDLEITIAPL